MSGLQPDTPTPTNIVLHQRSRILEVQFSDGAKFEFSFEFLRVYSPSAEVRGHSPDQAVLQVGKQDVILKNIEPIGNYAVRLVFDDGHDSGLYSWDLLYELGQRQAVLWEDYLARLALEGASRAPAENAPPSPKKSCGHHH